MSDQPSGPARRAADTIRERYALGPCVELAEIIERETGAGEAIEIILGLLAMMPPGNCEDFHHNKRDRHEWSEDCPCVKRHEAKLAKARAFLARFNRD